MKKVNARPRRIPAFGEWNYYGDGWPVTHYLDSAMQMQAGLVISLPASPKPLKKAVKWSDSGKLQLEAGEEEEQQRRQRKVAVGQRGEHGAKKQAKVSDAGPETHFSTAANYKVRRVAVKAVDEDLYVIPPDMLCHTPRRRLGKRLWMGCLGCVA